MKYVSSVTLASALALTIGFAGPAAAAEAYLTGTISAANGDKLAGVSVSAKPVTGTITTTVFTDASGAYYFPALEAGQYRVWAQAVSFDTGKSEVDLAGTRQQDFALAPMADYFRQLSGEMALAALPHETPEDKRLWQIVHNNCTGCHTPNYPLQNKFDEAGWTAILDLMKMVNVGGIYQGADHKPNGIIAHHEKELAAYLARARGPGPSSVTLQTRPRPTGEAARAVVTEYDVPTDPDLHGPNKYVVNDGSDWSLGAPSNFFIGAKPHDAWADLDGNLWFTQNNPSRDISIGRVDRATGAVKFIKIAGQNGLAASSHGMTRDPRGNIWFNVGPTVVPGQAGLAKLDPKTEKIEVFVPPKPMSPTGGATTVDWGPNGKIWASSPDGGLSFDPQTKEFTEFKSLTYKTKNGTGTTYGMAADKDGNGWWAEMTLDIVAKGDLPSKESLEVKLPPVESAERNLTADDKKLYADFIVPDFNTPVPWAQGPRRMGADKQGNYVYVCDSFGGNLTRIDIHTLESKTIPLPNAAVAHPYQATVDSQHNVWLNVMNADQVMRYNPQTEQWTAFDLPSRGETRYVSLLEKDGKMQVVVPEYRALKIAVMSFRSEADMAAVKAKAGK
jgi:streptogramin lyase